MDQLDPKKFFENIFEAVRDDQKKKRRKTILWSILAGIIIYLISLPCFLHPFWNFTHFFSGPGACTRFTLEGLNSSDDFDKFLKNRTMALLGGNGNLPLNTLLQAAGVTLNNGSIQNTQTISSPTASYTTYNTATQQLLAGSGISVITNNGGTIINAVLGDNIDLSSEVTNSLPAGQISNTDDVTAASNKVTLGGSPLGAVLKPFSIDVNEAALNLANLGGVINLANQVTGVLPVTNGGTGLSTAGADGTIFTVVAGVPTWVPASAVIVPNDVTAGSTKVTLGGTPTGAALQPFSIDVNEANLSLQNIGGSLVLTQITPGTNGQVLTTVGGVSTWTTPAATTVSNTSTGNDLTTTVNGVTGTAVPIINTNLLTLDANNQLVSTINGIASAALPLFTTDTVDNGLSIGADNKIELGGKLHQDTNIDQAGYDLTMTSGNVGIGTAAPAYTLDIAGMLNQTTALPSGRTTNIHSGDNVIGAGIQGVGFTSQSAGGDLEYLFAGDATATGGYADQAAVGITNFGTGNNTQYLGGINGGNYFSTIQAQNTNYWVNTQWDQNGIRNAVSDTITSSETVLRPGEYQVNSAEVTLSQYYNTRDDSGSTTPINFLYTDTVGRVLSAPTSYLFGALPVNNGLTNNAGTIQLGGTLVQDTVVDGQGYNMQFTKNNLAQFLGQRVDIGQDGNALNGADYQIAIGNGNTLNTDYNFAFGDGNTLDGSHSVAVGYDNVLSSNNEYIVGYSNKSILGSKDNYIMGESNDFSGANGSHINIFGSYNTGTNTADYVTVLGLDNTIDKSGYSTVVGRMNTISGVNNAYILGENLTAAGDNTVNIGVSDISKISIDADGRLNLRGPLSVTGSDGNAGDILVSQGSGANVAPVWTSPSAVLAGATTNTISFASGTNVLTSTVNGVAATTSINLNIPANGFSIGAPAPTVNAPSFFYDPVNLVIYYRDTNGNIQYFWGPKPTNGLTSTAGNFQELGGSLTHNTNINQAGFATTFTGAGNFGIGAATPGNKLEITQGTAGNSGLRFTNLTSASVTSASNNKILTVDAAGDVILAPDGSGCVPLAGAATNECLGTGALQLVTSGTSNVAVGDSALQAMTAGTNNTAVGYQALTASSVGNNNTALGFQALTSNLGGGSNTALGYRALRLNDTGNFNASVGMGAMGANTGGSTNTAMGYQALAANTTGSNNVGIGWNALAQSVTGNSNVGLGMYAGYSITAGANNTMIGMGAGYYNTAGVITSTTGSNNIVIGTNNNMLPVSAGSNQLNIGNLIFGTGVGIGATMATGNVGIGTYTPGNKLEITQGTAGNSGLRFTNLNSGSTTVANNSLQLSLNASGDVILTPDAVTANRAWSTTGNTALSAATNFMGTTDAVDVPFRTNNVEKMRLFSLVNPSLGMGRSTLTGVNGGASSYSGPTIFTGAAGNFSGSTGWDFIMDDDNNATNNQIRFRANGDGAAGTIDIMTVDEVGGGRVGIGTTAPALLLHVGSATVTTGTSVARFENAGGTCTVTPNVAGGITCTSDVRFKKNIETIDDSLLNKLAGVQVRQYNMKVDADGTQKQIGFIAQNLETIFPSTVMTDEQGNKSVSYSALTPILTQAMQELNLKVDTNQTNTIATVTTLNTGLEAQSGSLTTLEQTLADNTAAIESLQQNVTSLEDRVAALENAGAVTTTTPPTDGIFTTLTTFMEDAVFNKVVTFKDMILVEGPAVFSDLVQFNDTVVFNKDAAGHATIASGDSKIDITFDKPYPSAPVVTVTPNEKVDALYYVTNVTASGFTIEMDPSATENVKFSWNAVATASATPAP